MWPAQPTYGPVANTLPQLILSAYEESRVYVMPIEKIIRKGEGALSLSYYDYNNGMDIIINLVKKDEDNLTGDVLNIYTLIATRKKQLWSKSHLVIYLQLLVEAKIDLPQY